MARRCGPDQPPASRPLETPEQLREEIDRLRRERMDLEDETARLRRERDRLRDELTRLTAALDAAQRAAKRQAAPFSKGAPVPHPKRPGRKPAGVWTPSEAPTARAE